MVLVNTCVDFGFHRVLTLVSIGFWFRAADPTDYNGFGKYSCCFWFPSGFDFGFHRILVSGCRSDRLHVSDLETK
ncbi:hypothetical protein L2E82_25227 [Cichorium intybus]|uniref:Uncharacterized protein n=1 Tax=Cichorium intybus TaxID=13427 RepID=A0ACB9E330_CICIN|nr:hypothetical protein L2E82_25227 [Cichorium intybus]